MVKRPAEMLMCLALLGLATVAFASSYWVAGGINAASTDQPMRLPRILLAIWMVLAAACALRAAFWAQPVARPGLPANAIAFITVLLLMSISLPYLGYLLPVTMGLAALLWLLGERQPLRFALTLLILGPGLWAVFHHGLGLRLPLLLSGGAL